MRIYRTVFDGIVIIYDGAIIFKKKKRRKSTSAGIA